MVKIQVFILSGIMVERILKFFYFLFFFSFNFLLKILCFVSFVSVSFFYMCTYFFVFRTAQDTDYPVETGTSNEAL